MHPRANELLGQELGDDDFHMIAGIVHREAGIVIRDHKRAMVRGRLMRRVRDLGLRSIGDYCARLKGPGLQDELSGLLNVLTTNHTAFYREAHHFAHLEEVALPWVASQMNQDDGRVRIWCAAASTGEEPYTIAATVNASGLSRRAADLKILATDIDTDVLMRAERAVYPRASLEALPPERRERLLPEAPGGEDSWRVGADLRRMLAFRRLNIISAWPFAGTFQIIFCRNMLIYFDVETKISIVRRLVERLTPGGFLYLGHSEALTHAVPGLKPCGRTAYRKS